jgi:hypothetical protein
MKNAVRWLPLMVLVTACAPEVSNLRVCTAIFSYVSATVVDSNGAPVTGAFTVLDSVARTGKFLSVDQQSYPPGQVTVFSDAFVADVDTAGDIVAVVGRGSDKTFHAVYQFASDTLGCHIRKVSGPDTVVAR